MKLDEPEYGMTDMKSVIEQQERQMSKAQHISQMIADKANSIATVNGWTFNDAKAWRLAIDFVLGEGTYDKLVSDVYDELREQI
jgi:hypothetical protein